MIFSAISWAAVYFVIWWTTLFAVLPFGVRSQIEEGEVTPGSEGAAPARPRLLRIFGLTTLVASAAFAVLFVLLTQHLVSLDSIPFLPRFDPVR
ncbi:DUF1467 family protein [Chenggangzhangella methanolivorans]|uniref:DUF1467 family protein n=1 Tax=Chenggangzhangella methanolivorans TaxID=1437009 RepID=A0A9E6R8M8_9HYPH|nr:DUF1467 family protein [Chenggangzhangella methanolivorans]QZN99844.1 DUF1467 family protein [Chenggangzhangella methanolivorans]